MLAGKDAKIESLVQEVASLRTSLRDRDRAISTFHAAAESLIHVDHKSLDVAVKEMYAQVVLGTGKGLRKVRARATHEASLSSTGPTGAAGAGKGSLSSTAPAGSAAAPKAASALPTAGATGASSGTAGDAPTSGRGRPRPDAISLKEHLETVEGMWLTLSTSSRWRDFAFLVWGVVRLGTDRTPFLGTGYL